VCLKVSCANPGDVSVLFTDESRLNLFRADGRRRVYRRRNERYADCFVIERDHGSFYSCSCPIAEMRKSHKAVLSGSCETWTAAPWSIVSVSKLYKTAL
jgi:hypothetical protein